MQDEAAAGPQRGRAWQRRQRRAARGGGPHTALLVREQSRAHNRCGTVETANFQPVSEENLLPKNAGLRRNHAAALDAPSERAQV